MTRQWSVFFSNIIIGTMFFSSAFYKTFSNWSCDKWTNQKRTSVFLSITIKALHTKGLRCYYLIMQKHASLPHYVTLTVTEIQLCDQKHVLELISCMINGSFTKIQVFPNFIFSHVKLIIITIHICLIMVWL